MQTDVHRTLVLLEPGRSLQLAACTRDHFPNGPLRMLINVGLPTYIFDMQDHSQSLSGGPVGILRIAFNQESDDARSCLRLSLDACEVVDMRPSLSNSIRL